jgi:hypothetical protein
MRPWSYSRLGTYEDCPKQYWYKYVEGMPGFRPSSPAASRGTLLHSKAEAYLKDEIKIYPPEFQKVSSHTMMLKHIKATPEQKLAVTDTWEPCDYDAPEAYFRAIIDIVYPTLECKVINVEDWKTGQAYPEHAEQLRNYTAVAAAHYPDAEEYHTRLIYIDQGIVTKPIVTTKERVKPIRLMMDGRIKNAEEDAIWPTTPSVSACRWCDYARKHGGPCAF